ncbi:trans-aconitate 2-methyltransferase [Streptacidiphilus sp. EB103A]|uniref:class I SAM-dependent methyltransferase n=1 Tax=Streptacidiphilus sp. EB103A TaxID=3156275 RepID=UPI003516C463
MSIFRGAASAYQAYRPGLPDEVTQLLAATLAECPWPALLDLGTGTGQVPAALCRWVSRIDIVDVDADMLAEAQRTLGPLVGDTPLSAHCCRAEDFTTPHPGYRADLVTASRSFHWMDPGVLHRLDAVTAPAGNVAVMGDGSLWTASSTWTQALRTLIQSYLGEERRAGEHGPYRGERRPYGDLLAASAFSQVTEHTVPFRRTWSPLNVVGYLDSTSFAAPSLFGDRHEAFREEALELLASYAVDGALVEDAVFTVLLARRPQAGRS